MFGVNANKLVAVVVPLSRNHVFTEAEGISLHHLLHHLGRYDKFFLAPHGSDVSHEHVQNKYFHQKYFGSAEAHSKLLLSRTFYEAFIDYEYILIYHLDALVFSDSLEEWCQKGYDYVAAPWIKHKDAPYAGMPEFEGKIGNGGFSLRRIRSFLQVINSKRYYVDPDDYWRRFCANKSAFSRIVNLPRKHLVRAPFINNARTEIARRIKVEDMFWANRGPHYYEPFSLAPIDVALKFAFECVPRHCYALNNRELPFGCHAWERYDREFWEPFLLR